MMKPFLKCVFFRVAEMKYFLFLNRKKSSEMDVIEKGPFRRREEAMSKGKRIPS